MLRGIYSPELARSLIAAYIWVTLTSTEDGGTKEQDDMTVQDDTNKRNGTKEQDDMTVQDDTKKRNGTKAQDDTTVQDNIKAQWQLYIMQAQLWY